MTQRHGLEEHSIFCFPCFLSTTLLPLRWRTFPLSVKTIHQLLPSVLSELSVLNGTLLTPKNISGPRGEGIWVLNWLCSLLLNSVGKLYVHFFRLLCSSQSAVALILKIALGVNLHLLPISPSKWSSITPAIRQTARDQPPADTRSRPLRGYDGYWTMYVRNHPRPGIIPR